MWRKKIKEKDGRYFLRQSAPDITLAQNMPFFCTIC